MNNYAKKYEQVQNQIKEQFTSGTFMGPKQIYVPDDQDQKSCLKYIINPIFPSGDVNLEGNLVKNKVSKTQKARPTIFNEIPQDLTPLASPGPCHRALH